MCVLPKPIFSSPVVQFVVVVVVKIFIFVLFFACSSLSLCLVINSLHTAQESHYRLYGQVEEKVLGEAFWVCSQVVKI